MPDVKFDSLLDHLLGGYQWTTGQPHGALFLRDTWTPDKSDGFVLDATGAGAIEVAAPSYARTPIVSAVKNLDAGGHRVLLDAAVIDFGILEAGYDFDTLLIFELVTNDGDSWLLSAHDLGAQTTGGVTPERCVLDSDGLYQLTAP